MRKLFNRIAPYYLLTLIFLIIPTITIGGTINGTIRDTENNPVQEAFWVEASFDMNEWIGVATNDGSYSLDLAGGNVMLRARPESAESWYYQLYYPNSIDYHEAEWVWVPEEGSIDDIDFNMMPGGKITGSVVQSDGSDFEDNIVYIQAVGMENMWDFRNEGFPLENPSEFISPSIPPGMYWIKFFTDGEDPHTTTYLGNTWNLLESEMQFIMPQQVIENVEVQMIMGGGISGRVMGDNEPVPGTVIQSILYLEGYLLIPNAMAFTNEDGEYFMNKLPPTGNYVMFHPPEPFIPQWYYNAYDFWSANEVMVESGQVTTNISVRLERGVTLTGRVTLPDGEPVDPWTTEIEVINGYGDDNNLNVDWSDNGTWTSTEPIPPGIISILAYPSDNSYLAEQYYGGTSLPWEANWVYMGGGHLGGPFDIQLQPAGAISGRVTDHNGEPVAGEYVALFNTEALEIDDVDTDEDGYYYFGNLPEGNYIVMAEMDPDFDNGIIYPNVFSGNTYDIREATPVVVEAGQTTEENLQFSNGGVLQVTVTDPDGNRYSFEEGLLVAILPLDENGDLIWEINSYSDEDDENIDNSFVLAPGTYSAVGIPINFATDENTPAVRRTFYGGSFNFDGAETFEITAGNVTDITIRMVVEGHAISGSARTEDRKFGAEMVFSFDENDFFASAFVAFERIPNGNFYLNGHPNGNYSILAVCNPEGFAISTWYPNIAAPGAIPESNPNTPEAASSVSMDNEFISGVNIVLQTPENFVSAPDKGRNPAIMMGYQLSNAYPNPFNNLSQMAFNLPTESLVSLKIHDVLGREVRTIVNGKFPAGAHQVQIDGHGLPAGVYFVKMKAGAFNTTRQVLLLK